MGTVDPTDNSRTLENFQFELIGGAGDGSNELVITGGGPTDARGISIDKINVR